MKNKGADLSRWRKELFPQPNFSLYVKHTHTHTKPPALSTTHMWVVVHDQQVLGASLWACPLVGSNKPGDVVMLQQR